MSEVLVESAPVVDYLPKRVLTSNRAQRVVFTPASAMTLALAVAATTPCRFNIAGDDYNWAPAGIRVRGSIAAAGAGLIRCIIGGCLSLFSQLTLTQDKGGVSLYQNNVSVNRASRVMNMWRYSRAQLDSFPKCVPGPAGANVFPGGGLLSLAHNCTGLPTSVGNVLAGAATAALASYPLRAVGVPPAPSGDGSTTLQWGKQANGGAGATAFTSNAGPGCIQRVYVSSTAAATDGITIDAMLYLHQLGGIFSVNKFLPCRQNMTLTVIFDQASHFQGLLNAASVAQAAQPAAIDLDLQTWGLSAATNPAVFTQSAQPELVMYKASPEISARLSALLEAGPFVTKVPKIVVDQAAVTGATWNIPPRQLSYSEFERLRAIYVGFFTTAGDGPGWLAMANSDAAGANVRIGSLQSYYDNIPVEPTPIQEEELYDYFYSQGLLRSSGLVNAKDFLFNFSFCSSFVGDLDLCDSSWYCKDVGMMLPEKAKNWQLRGTQTTAADLIDVIIVYEGQQTFISTDRDGVLLTSPQV